MARLTFDQTFAAISSVAVVGGIVAGFLVLGSPGKQRLLAADQQRLNDLNAIAQELYWKSQENKDKAKVPASLPVNLQKLDPLTQQPYTFKRVDDQNFQLCATFDTDSAAQPWRNPTPQPAQVFWNHPVGEHCYDFNLTDQPPSLF
jgi:hypothetical protein